MGGWGSVQYKDYSSTNLFDPVDSKNVLTRIMGSMFKRFKASHITMSKIRKNKIMYIPQLWAVLVQQDHEIKPSHSDTQGEIKQRKSILQIRFTKEKIIRPRSIY